MHTQNILIIGNGGREYALALSLRKDKRVKDIFISPQNDAALIYLQAKSFSFSNHNELLESIKKHNISLVVIGPEAPLMDKVSDFLESNNIPVFAPSYQNAMLEGSKAYMKEFISKIGVPTARYKEISLENINEGMDFIESLPLPIVLKASGLCAGKGVLILDSKKEAKEKLEIMLKGELFGESGKIVVIEEYLDGYELSVFAISNGSEYVVLPACQDHKRLLDNDKGPNTGGMGAYSNLPKSLYNKDLESKIKEKILTPTFNALKDYNNPYKGVIFAGIMVVNNEPYLLEYNVRFGDPECEALMPLLDTPLLDIFNACAKGDKIGEIAFKDKCSVCVVISSGDYAQDKKSSKYPAKVSFSKDIESILQSCKAGNIPNGSHVVFANTTIKNGEIYANSGRAIIAVGLGDNMQEARDNAYKIVDGINFDEKHYRSDIAYQALR